MPAQSARQNATNSELDAKKIVTNSGLTSAQRDELIEQFVELVTDNMDTKDLVRYVSDSMTEYFDKLSDIELKEDIDNYNRVHEMFKLLKAKDTVVNDEAEAFGNSWDKYMTLDTTTLSGIVGGQSQTVLFKPCSGLFNQPKMLPIRYMPITIELEIVHDNTEPVISVTTNGQNNFDITDGAGGNTSTSWQIQNVQVKVDTVTLEDRKSVV